MSFLKNTITYKFVITFISVGIVSLILWNTYKFFKLFKQEERLKMEIIAAAQNELFSNTDLKASTELPFKIISTNNSIPMIWTDLKDSIISSQNLDSIKALKPSFVKKQLQLMKEENDAIEIRFRGKKMGYIYYKDSDLLNKLTYYPLALILILALFLTVVVLVFRSNKVSEQNKLWTGMAKETAHQIGTPLSSLLGWIAILKSEPVNNQYVDEIEKDVYRLNTIANRFSKIGSVPTLTPENFVELVKSTYQYLEARTSKQISFTFHSKNEDVQLNVSQELMSWVIENLIKNAIDAMQGKGSIDVKLWEDTQKVYLTISDTGKGISKKLKKIIFNPGFTTKKRGWGLGLSLSKRIIEDYHKGKISVHKTEIGKGSTFLIVLKKSTV